VVRKASAHRVACSDCSCPYKKSGAQNTEEPMRRSADLLLHAALAFADATKSNDQLVQLGTTLNPMGLYQAVPSVGLLQAFATIDAHRFRSTDNQSAAFEVRSRQFGFPPSVLDAATEINAASVAAIDEPLLERRADGGWMTVY
jgi:hypothetical protein